MLAGKCLREHPGWTDDQAAGHLAILYAGYRPDYLAAVLRAAVRAERERCRP